MSELLKPMHPGPKPLPFPDVQVAVAPLPLEALPTCLREYIKDVTDRQRCPPDFVAITGLCALSAALGNKATISPKQYDDWEVTPNLWGAIVGRPSAMKSPAMKAALAPLYKIQDENKVAFENQLIEHKVTTELFEIEAKNAKEAARKAIKDGEREKAFEMLMKNSESPRPPTPPRLVINDSTVEKLGELLNENPTGLLLERDELTGWLAKLRTEEGMSDRAFYLQCFDGNGRYTFDRIGRGTIEIESTTLSIVGGIQPSKITPLIRGAMKGHDNDGLIQRLQLLSWPEDSTTWRWEDRAPNRQAYEAYESAFRKLVNFERQNSRLRFSLSAQSLFIQWMEEIQRQARSGEVHPAMESHLIKMPQTIAALALIFELVERDGEFVGEKAIAMALDFADYLKSHAGRLYSIVNNAPVANAKLIIKRRDKLSSSFTLRELHQKGWAGLSDRQDVNEALEVLVDHQYLTGVSVNDTGGRPTIQYYWNLED